jgi:hypothetical protein
MDANKDGVVSAEELAAALGQFNSLSYRLSADNSAAAEPNSSAGSQWSRDFLSSLASRSYSSYADYSMNNLMQGLSFTA